MSKSAKKAADQAEREKVHKRYSNRREPDVIYPAKKQVDFYDADIHQRVAVYVRVSTDNLGQETSYENETRFYVLVVFYFTSVFSNDIDRLKEWR